MAALYLFLFKSAAVSGLMLLWYYLALRGRRMHQYNRYFLLLALCAALVVPLLEFHLFTVQESSVPLLTGRAFQLHAVDVAGTSEAAIVTGKQASTLDISVVLISICILVSILLIARLLIQVMHIQQLKKRFATEEQNGYTITYTDLERAPFSFCSSLYWRKDLDMNDAHSQLILRHELTHIQQRHSYDKLFAQGLACVFWMNPFFRLIAKELEMVHEFIADDAAIDSNEHAGASFAGMVLALQTTQPYSSPEHRFFSSPIKRRLTMLQTSKKMKAAWLRRMGVLPVLAGSVLIFSFTTRIVHAPANVNKDGKKIILVIDAGHGGVDRGCEKGQLVEKDLSLKIAKRISTLAPDYNVEVRLTRSTNETVSLADRVTFSNKLHPDAFISIHVDDRKGGEAGQGSMDIAVAKWKENIKSRELAYAIYRNVNRPEWTQGNTPSEKSLFVLNNNTAPSILIEMGDIKNATQMKELDNDEQLDQLCTGILKGVVAAHS